MKFNLLLVVILFSVCSNEMPSFIYFTWIITPNDIDREIQVWKDRNEGKLHNFWDFVAINYDAEQIIHVLEYAKNMKDKSVKIICDNLFWKAEIIYQNK